MGRESPVARRFVAISTGARPPCQSPDRVAVADRLDGTGHGVRRSPHADRLRSCTVRLTVVGSGTTQPQPETPASGLLIETDTTAILVDCGQGIIRELMSLRDPRELDAIIVGHMHADHYIDLVSLRYLLPWAGFTGRRVPVLLPP